MADKFQILVLNGPNLNMLGTREPEKYGTLTLSEIVNRLSTEAASLNVDLDHFQSNAEYAIIDRIHQAKDNVDYILINPAAFTHQCCYPRRTARGEYPVYRDPPEQRARPRAVPPPFVSVGYRRWRYLRTGRRRLFIRFTDSGKTPVTITLNKSTEPTHGYS
jgi:hypothetical protein